MTQPKHILLFGAGKSATVLIDYLIKNAAAENWHISIADTNMEMILVKTNNASCVSAVKLDINDAVNRGKLVIAADIVISMMPPALHFLIAQECVAHKKNLLTASYMDAQIKSLQDDIEKNGLLFLCEMGLDPGIDHISAMHLIDGIHKKGGEISSFKSHCGGLVEPKSDNNPWHYKISWNPRNIVLAGKAGAHYLENGQEIKKGYAELFTKNEAVYFSKLGRYGWYPNRDSISYISLYGLQKCTTFIRTTLRHPDFFKGWDKITSWHLTDENVFYETDSMRISGFFATHFAKHTLQKTVMEALHEDSGLKEQFEFLGLNDTGTFIDKGLCSAVDVLQFILEKKLALQATDRDMILMMHEVEYQIYGTKYKVEASLVVKGDDNLRTAMAKTVGLPLGIATKLILNGTIKTKGLQIPTKAEIYKPVLEELEKEGICFVEKTVIKN